MSPVKSTWSAALPPAAELSASPKDFFPTWKRGRRIGLSSAARFISGSSVSAAAPCGWRLARFRVLSWPDD